jgi:hypothetical protein
MSRATGGDRNMDSHAADKSPDIDLRTEPTEGPIDPDAKRFDIFLIDTGWNRPVSRAVRKQLPLIFEFQRQDTLYLLSREQSIEIGRRFHEFIGHDPTILVYDQFAPQSTPGSFRGFRLNLGLIRRPEQALSRLQEFVRFLAEHRTAVNLDREVKRQMHREGFEGLVKIVRGGLEAGIELV